MSIKIMAMVWEHSQHAEGQLLTMLAIADHADDLGRAYPAMDSLARKTRLTRRHMQRVIKALEDSEELKIHRNAGPHGTHLFQINLSLLMGVDIMSVDKTSTRTKRPRTFEAKKVSQMSTESSLEPSYKNISSNEEIYPAEFPKSSSKKSKLNGKTSLPPDFEITDAMRQWGRTYFKYVDLDKTTEQWADSMRANDKRYKDWPSAWRNGIRNAVEWKRAIMMPITWEPEDDDGQ